MVQMRRPSLSFDGEGKMNVVDMRDDAAPPWSKAVSRMNSSFRNLGGLVFNHEPALVRIGKTMSRSR